MHLVNLCVEQLYFYIPSLESSASLYSGHLCCPAFPSLCGPLFHLLLHSYYISQFIMPQRHTEAKAMTLVPASRASPRVDVKLNWQEGSAASLWPFKRSQNKKRKKGRKRSQGMFLQSCTLFFFYTSPLASFWHTAASNAAGLLPQMKLQMWHAGTDSAWGEAASNTTSEYGLWCY